MKEKIMESKTLVGFGIGILAGAVIGGSIALLFAPKTGQETRMLIKDKTTDVIDETKAKARGIMAALKDGGSEYSPKG
jgi:gas vesicle protein